MKTHIIQQWLNRMFHQLIPNIGSIVVMAAMLFAYDVHAAALNATSPSVISYQGTLSTAGGTVVNGSVGMGFRLYNAQSGGSVVWSESHLGTNAVPVSNGLFNVSLGSITPIPSTVWNNPTLYLAIQIEGDNAELSPREVVSAVPYAMNAAGTIVVPDGSITTAKIVEGAVTKSKLDPNITFTPNVFSIIGNDTSFTSSGSVVGLPITLSKTSSVLVTVSIRAISTQAGDEFVFGLTRDGVNLSLDTHLEAGKTGHQYFTYTFIDTNVPAGTHQYGLGVYMASGSGQRDMARPVMFAVPLP